MRDNQVVFDRRVCPQMFCLLLCVPETGVKAAFVASLSNAEHKDTIQKPPSVEEGRVYSFQSELHNMCEV